VVVEDRDRDARALGDFVDRRPVVSALGEDFCRDALDDLAPCLGGKSLALGFFLTDARLTT
jgi:hypothetical protein